ALYTIKDGEIVVKNGEIVKDFFGRTIAVKFKEDIDTEVIKDVKEKFKRYYTISFSNYIIQEDEIRKIAYIWVEG
ncbi:MAG: formylmethanofuran dehydrogenase subunit A, partial [Thermoprotei archaeon]